MPTNSSDTTSGVRVLRMFRKLMLDGRRHFQLDLAKEFECSTQTINRIATLIEDAFAVNLEDGFENRKKWYRMKTIPRNHLGLDFEELRYLSVCRDLAGDTLPDQIRNRIDDTILNLAVLMADHDFAEREKAQKPQFSFFSKGRIDYTPHFAIIEQLQQAAEERKFCLVLYTNVQIKTPNLKNMIGSYRP